MSRDRAVDWEGFANARDLGGLPTRNGGSTRFGAFIRSADLRFVTDTGWRAARRCGVTTVLDLRNDDEVAAAEAAAAGVTRIRVPLDGVADTELWRRLDDERLNGTPLYYPPFLASKADRCAAVVSALARVDAGTVVFHCGAGRDRTGLVTLLLLALADVHPEAIAEDYELTTEPLRLLCARLGRPDERPGIERDLAARGTTPHAAVLDVLSGFDAETYLLAAGVTPGEISTLRRRLLGPAE